MVILNVLLKKYPDNLQLVGEHNLNANDGERAVRVELRFDMFCDYNIIIYLIFICYKRKVPSRRLSVGTYRVLEGINNDI